MSMQYEIASSYKAKYFLIYKLGGFIELSKSHKNSIEFDSVIFKTLSPWMGLVEIPKMKILSNGSIILDWNSREHGYKIKSFGLMGIPVFWVSKEVMFDLKYLLGYISFGELNTDYETKYVYDLSTAITEVYEKGEMKRVRGLWLAWNLWIKSVI